MFPITFFLVLARSFLVFFCLLSAKCLLTVIFFCQRCCCCIYTSCFCFCNIFSLKCSKLLSSVYICRWNCFELLLFVCSTVFALSLSLSIWLDYFFCLVVKFVWEKKKLFCYSYFFIIIIFFMFCLLFLVLFVYKIIVL